MDIIELVRRYGDLEFELDQTTLEKRLQDIIEFLQEERVQNVLEQQKGKYLGDFFYKKEMNLTKAKGSAYKGYDYNLIDAIFLAVLLSLYDQSLFKKLRNKSRIENPQLEEEQWMNAMINKLSRFETLWDEEVNQKSWEIISVNLTSLFHQFTLLSHLSDYAMGLQNKLYTLAELFEGLPDHHKVAFYNRVMKNRISYIEKEFDKYVQSLKKSNLIEYNEYKTHKKLVEIDKKFEK